MALSLKESRAVTNLAELLYDFLPGSGNPGWKGHVSIKIVAEKVGVGDFWQPGSKLPMIAALLQRTLEYRRTHFERLILEIVRAALTYRDRQGRPIQPSEIDKLNGLLLEVGFKFPDLSDPDLVSSLRIDSGRRAKERVGQAIEEERARASAQSRRRADVSTL